MKTAVIDYGAGNLRSIVRALDHLGEDCVVTSDKKTIESCSSIILPGVGAFREAMDRLTEKGLADLLKKEASDGRAVFGICLGMQLLFDRSFEFGETEGLGLIEGTVERIDTAGHDLRIPHVGWNTLEIKGHPGIYKDIDSGSYVYFVHSYSARTDDRNVTAYTDYGSRTVASVERRNVLGTQYHPEKSGDTGLKILKNFCDTVRHDSFTCN